MEKIARSTYRVSEYVGSGVGSGVGSARERTNYRTKEIQWCMKHYEFFFHSLMNVYILRIYVWLVTPCCFIYKFSKFPSVEIHAFPGRGNWKQRKIVRHLWISCICFSLSSSFQTNTKYLVICFQLFVSLLCLFSVQFNFETSLQAPVCFRLTKKNWPN